jgi:MFS family permease
LARTHAASVSGDALFAIGLAGSVFFSLDFTSARWRVALYLLLTIAPFAIAAPLIGPAIDRIKGGRRWIIVGSMLLRALLAFFVVRHMDSLLFYPEAFGMLIMQKIYSISKSAVIPSTVHSDEELVQANSKLTTLSSIAVVIAAIPGGILYAIGGGKATVALGAAVFAVGTILALQLPPTTVAAEPEGEAEREELRSAGITHASTAMSLIRGMVGFLSFMLAFDFKNAGSPLWQLGLVAATAQLGFFLGSLVVPRLRRVTSEERILVTSRGRSFVIDDVGRNELLGETSI